MPLSSAYIKKSFIILLLFFCCSAECQQEESSIFNDTSLYFVRQIDKLNPVDLTSDELIKIEKLFRKAVDEFNKRQQQYADSINQNRKKNRRQPLKIGLKNYFFRIVPRYNEHKEKEVSISGSCKDYYTIGRGRKSTYDKEWKRKFINGREVADGGSCFIYLVVNLDFERYNQLTMNGGG